jgi:hypothetical protein
VAKKNRNFFPNSRLHDKRRLAQYGANEPGAQADSHENDPLRLPSVPRLQQLLRSKLWDDTINAMEKGSRNRRLAKELEEIIQL